MMSCKCYDALHASASGLQKSWSHLNFKQNSTFTKQCDETPTTSPQRLKFYCVIKFRTFLHSTFLFSGNLIPSRFTKAASFPAKWYRNFVECSAWSSYRKRRRHKQKKTSVAFFCLVFSHFKERNFCRSQSFHFECLFRVWFGIGVLLLWWKLHTPCRQM